MEEITSLLKVASRDETQIISDTIKKQIASKKWDELKKLKDSLEQLSLKDLIELQGQLKPVKLEKLDKLVKPEKTTIGLIKDNKQKFDKKAVTAMIMKDYMERICNGLESEFGIGTNLGDSDMIFTYHLDDSEADELTYNNTQEFMCVHGPYPFNAFAFLINNFNQKGAGLVNFSDSELYKDLQLIREEIFAKMTE